MSLTSFTFMRGRGRCAIHAFGVGLTPTAWGTGAGVRIGLCRGGLFSYRLAGGSPSVESGVEVDYLEAFFGEDAGGYLAAVPAPAIDCDGGFARQGAGGLRGEVVISHVDIECLVDVT